MLGGLWDWDRYLTSQVDRLLIVVELRTPERFLEEIHFLTRLLNLTPYVGQVQQQGQMLCIQVSQ